MPALPQWSDASPEERGVIRETIHRHLLEHQRHTENALVHALNMSPETISEALRAMLASKAVVTAESKGRIYYAAVPRK